MSESTLSSQELDSLLEGAEIVSDDTGQYTKNEPVQAKEIHSETASSSDKADRNQVKDFNIKNMTTKQKINANLLLDTSVGVTVELGRTNIQVKDILALGEGSIIELLKPANEPVNLLVNDHLIARGEVVVIDENFGTRITNIIDPKDRLKH